MGFSLTEAGAEKPAYRGLRGSRRMTRRNAEPLEFCAPHALTPKLSRPQPGGANGGEGGLERRYHQGEKCRLGSDLERWVRTGA